MRSTLVLAVLAGLCALSVAFVVAKPEFSGRALGYAVASGVLGAVIVGSIAVAAGQAGVARALSRKARFQATGIRCQVERSLVIIEVSPES